MIYTIGHKRTYELAKIYCTQHHLLFQKKGRTKHFCGGSVWKTRREARNHCLSNFVVYGVLADWHTDTIRSKDGDWHDLLYDSILIKL